MNWTGRIGWLVSLGLCVASLALCPGHELIHREKHIGRLIGGFLFAFVCNGAFNIEHIRGHHVNVATPADTGAARFNQSFYPFLLQVLRKSFVDAWSLEKKRLNRKGVSALALIPPLWFKVMNPRVLAYQEGKSSTLEASNLRKMTSAGF